MISPIFQIVFNSQLASIGLVYQSSFLFSTCPVKLIGANCVLRGIYE